MDAVEYNKLKNALRKYLNYNELVAISSETNILLAPPIRASLHVTARCNSDCAYCPFRMSLSKSRLDLSLEITQKIIHDLADLGVKLLFISGGEPLLHKDIIQICNYAASLGLTVQLATNGLLLTYEIAQKLSKVGVCNLIMSLDSIEEEVYLACRGVRNPRIMETLDILSSFSEQKPGNASAVTFVVSQKNFRELPSFIRFINDYSAGKIRINIQPFHHSQYTKGNDVIANSKDEAEWIETMERVVTLKQEGCCINVSEDYLRNIPAFMFHNKKMTGPCLTGFSGIYIQDNLDVVPCWKLPSVGNLKKENLLDIWLSNLYSKAREQMIQRNCGNCMLMCHTSLGSWADCLYKNYHNYDKEKQSYKADSRRTQHD